VRQIKKETDQNSKTISTDLCRKGKNPRKSTLEELRNGRRKSLVLGGFCN
jgi:hypothetical protein